MHRSTYQTRHPASVILKFQELCLDPHCALRDPTKAFDTGSALGTRADWLKNFIEVFCLFHGGLKQDHGASRYFLSVTGWCSNSHFVH